MTRLLGHAKVIEHTDRLFRCHFQIRDGLADLDVLVEEVLDRLPEYLANRGKAMVGPPTFAVSHAEPLSLGVRVAVGPRPTRAEKAQARAAAVLEDLVFMFETGASAWEVSRRSGIPLSGVMMRLRHAGRFDFSGIAEREYRFVKGQIEEVEAA